MSQTAQQTGQRGCWWCGTGSSPLTLEHIIPVWMADVLEGTGRLDHAYTDPDDESGDPTRTWHAMKPDFKAKVVCGGCNNGWMSSLETNAKKRLPPLVHGVPTRLSRVDCAVLARWASKTGLMFQASDADANRVIAPRFFAALYKAGNPSGLPSTLRVWIGAVDAHGAWSRSFAGTLRPAGQPEVPYFTVLLAVDHVTFMVTGCEDDRLLAQLDLGHLKNGWHEISRRQSGLSWPPRYTFPADQFPGMPELLQKLAAVRAR